DLGRSERLRKCIARLEPGGLRALARCAAATLLDPQHAAPARNQARADRGAHLAGMQESDGLVGHQRLRSLVGWAKRSVPTNPMGPRFSVHVGTARQQFSEAVASEFADGNCRRTFAHPTPALRRCAASGERLKVCHPTRDPSTTTLAPTGTCS